MTPHEALRILDIATQPQAAGQLSRNDYVNCAQALGVLSETIGPDPAAGGAVQKINGRQPGEAIKGR